MLQTTISHTARVATKIRTLRRNREYSQEYMALLLNISQNAYSRLENGKTPITIDRLYQIGTILQTNPATLLESEEAAAVQEWQRARY
ncbi:helix-turn-helix domain-containing protein [Pseudobacter ginsenosidimutans]|jgi:transcriptional regulator with XRE-family HTH domain|uniref:Helix-turn-helix protein n=1 Tax=Pseudobacter ginsenosidimutans TaxID=661488 RepID=A0A4Q7MQB3_9BACT|nr:helix-turn-helix transcriptional regulator [Pseudobacter ginsenosidimutans]QEC42250.1 helix-turn-helix transcriptional regulator [Pseudobacter ginsenosidimutans]RZS70906.1 helix-turn-helix protein [Pseudobacter ginsenosidimutans]